MSVIHEIKATSKLDDGTVLSGTESISADGSTTLDVTVAGSTTNEAHAFSLDKTKLQSWYLVSSQNVTIKTNSTGSPGNTWNLIANVPFVWSASAAYFSNPVSANITTLYITNSGTTSARVRLRAGVNS